MLPLSTGQVGKQNLCCCWTFEGGFRYCDRFACVKLIGSSFFIAYVVTSWASLSTELTRLVPLVGDWIDKYYLECTDDRVHVPSIPYHVKYP